MMFGGAYAADINVPRHKKEVKEKPKLPEEHPEVHIGGKEVIPGDKHAKAKVKTVDDLPEGLRTERARAALAMRQNITVYKHNPSYGNDDALIQVVEFTDLNCLQCMTFLRHVDEIMAKDKYKDHIKYTHVHLPVDLYNSTNPAAFYGKIAQELGVFWEYRKQLFNINEIKDNTFMDKLINAGANPVKIRNLVRQKARQYYKELDADALLSKNMGETRPPVLFINGVKVGYNIKIEELEPLLDYEMKIF